MTLPRSLLRFWYAWGALGPVVRPQPWGQVVGDARYPLVWESNHAAVLEHHADVRAEDIRVALEPTLRTTGATHEHVEFWDPDGPCPAVDELRPGAERIGQDVVMVFEGDPSRTPETAADVSELEQPDEAFWHVYRSSRDEFGGTLTAETIDQLVARDREVLVPAGLRIFAAVVDGEVGGFVSLVSLAGVGYIDNVVTLGRYRRRGLASASTMYAVRAGLAAGNEAIHLLAEEDGRPSRLYERLGFRVRARVVSLTRPLRRSPAADGPVGVTK
jgi:ribosomal protein S18 acetylase RimI-like enzyme